MKNCVCTICGKHFHLKQSKINMGRGKFCSRPCWYKAGFSKESRKKMSESHKGIPTWNKGISPSLITRNKISNTLKGHVISYEQRNKISKSCKGKNRGAKNGMWKGGIRRSGKYVYITLPNGVYISEHRYLVEKFLNRKLLKNEVVHHVNFRRDDNRIENLVVMDKTEHSSFHNLSANKNISHSLKTS